MKQIIQDLKNGHTILEEVPAPKVKRGQVLIQTSRSLVSLGTERMLVEFGKANFIEKARKQPDKVKMVLDKVKTDGLKPTVDAVFNKLNQPLPLGYCNVGKVLAVGQGVKDIKVGDRVSSNGHHAEFVSIPENLVAKIPDSVSDEEASFTVIGAIGLQGIRLLNPTLGETVVVVGLGLIGLVTAELLIANGCNVIGVDFDPQKLNIANKKGIITVNPSEGTDVVKFTESFTNGEGADGVIITASNKSNDIISQSAKMSRKRGRIVLVGVVGLNISRADFYEKELTFQVSCSYGPGRYDDDYEQKGKDYPLPFVRWTEKRNFEAILRALETKRLDVAPLITEIVDFENYQQIYNDMAGSKSIASILKYSSKTIHQTVTPVEIYNSSFEQSNACVGIIGAGNFTNATILPALKPLSLNLKYIASAGGLTAKTLAQKGGFKYATSDYNEILSDAETDLVMITTRHNLHAKMAIDSLKAGKHVFVEKPLAINQEELDEIVKAYIDAKKTVTVGFNRRFAPLAQKMRSLVGDTPLNIVATMNAGYIPKNVWIHDLEIGGGRIIGEACHFIDLCSFLAGSKVKAVCMNALGENPDEGTDNASIILHYENGSNAVINYFANGSKSYSKERVEVFSQEKTLIMDNWRVLKGFGTEGFSKMKTGQDKGHKEQFRLLVEHLKNGKGAIIPFDEIVNTTQASFAAIKSLKEKRWVDLAEFAN